MSERKGLVLFLLVVLLVWSPSGPENSRLHRRPRGGRHGRRHSRRIGDGCQRCHRSGSFHVSNDTGSYRINYMDPGRIRADRIASRIQDHQAAGPGADGRKPDSGLHVGGGGGHRGGDGPSPGALLQSSNATLSNLIDNERIETLPLAQGNPSHLLILAPGASSPPGGGWKWDEPVVVHRPPASIFTVPAETPSASPSTGSTTWGTPSAAASRRRSSPPPRPSRR